STKEFGSGDMWVCNHVNQTKCKKFLVITKADLSKKEIIDKQINSASAYADFDAVCVLSSKSGEGLKEFITKIQLELPFGPAWYDRSSKTDQSQEVLICEIIREKALYNTKDEVPHSIGVALDDLEFKEDKNTFVIACTLYVERESQKPILIGKGASMIKQIGKSARSDLQKLLGAKVYLDLQVKVQKNWRRDLNKIEKFGYGFIA
ncbi:MAG: GTPase Era, partial [Coriobacteriales bacterium]|nr:GTPase Era [Coriobacteriales bacterium]